MEREIILSKIIDSVAVAVIRMKDPSKLIAVANSIYEGGVNSIEVTMTVPDALKVISQVTKEVGGYMLVGVGSVTDSETVERAIEAGAKFVVSPILKKEIINSAHKNDVPVIPGAFSPTEILTAHEYGADITKVFPADVLGMSFFKSIKAPMPNLNLMPTGGVSLTNAVDWLKSGASAVGVGSALLDMEAIDSEKYDVIKNNAKILMKGIKDYKKMLGS